MNVKETLKELNYYFAGKLLAGDYEFINCGEHTAKINIDGFEFEVWTANNQEDYFGFYEGLIYHRESPSNPTIGTFENKEDRIKAWEKMKPHIIEYRKKELVEEKRKQIESLTNQLNELENGD